MRMWQINNMNKINENISQALKNYIEKHGLPEQIVLEHGGLEAIELPESMNIVVSAVRIPKNILLIGSLDEISML